MSRRNLLLLVVLMLVSLVCQRRSPRNLHARYVSDGYSRIDEWSLDPPADEELMAGAMRGMVDVLRRRGDEHSGYFKPRAAELLRESMRGDFGGVGVRIQLLGDPPVLTVAGPPEPGQPAFRAGVRADDKILEIDGHSTDDMTMDDVLDRMRGEVGQPVQLTVLHVDEDAPVTLDMVREKIQVPTVLGDRRLSDGSWRHLLEQDQRIALVRIATFGDQTFEELDQRIPELLKNGARAVVIDLRDNPGGSLDETIDVCNMFLPAGAAIVETRDRNGDVIERNVARGGQYVNLPMVVLINGNSASASEIMAACMQDNQRAIVVGQRSYGKGTVQRLEPMGSGETLLKLTFAQYWRPSNENIHRKPGTPEDKVWGVRPNEGFAEPLTIDEYIAYRKARSLRDLLPIDLPDASPGDASPGDASPGDASPEVDSPEDDGASGHAEDHAEDHADEQKQGEDDAPFVDEVLNRAIEHLQSQLDASAAVKVSPFRAG